MFALYKQETPTFPFHDYAQVLDIVRDIGAKTCLEFGPGSSTLALIESGLERIVTCEHDPRWIDEARRKFTDHGQVDVKQYHNLPDVLVDDLNGEQFDMAFVDSPKGYWPERKAHPGQEDCSRLNTLLFALSRAPVVLLHDALRPLERGSLGRLNAMGHKITLIPPRLAKIERKEP